MKQISGILFAKAAVAAIDNTAGYIIPYKKGGADLLGSDCQGFVKYCFKQAGGNVDHYKGSNDMYRACLADQRGIMIYKDAVKRNLLKPGMVVFIVDHDGGEAVRGYRDGLGDASHIGIVTMHGIIWTIDASFTNKRVQSKSKNEYLNVWTHCAFLPEVSEMGSDKSNATDIYPESVTASDSKPVSEPDSDSDKEITAVAYPYKAAVKTPNGGTLNIRSMPTDVIDNRKGALANGTVVTVTGRRTGWEQINVLGQNRWVKEGYLVKLPD
ncbi:hypothetical protein FACS18948_6540 [Clostridia bacterium]|nr:hypothetical protein FACS18948_6540 [Clostridia bacterium]